MTELVTVFTLGLLSSAHCIGMCGGFAAAIGATKQPIWPNLSRQLVYSAGRIFTYSFLGACGGFAGLYLSRFESQLLTAQQVFSILAGVVMILVGASSLGLFGRKSRGAGSLTSLFAPLFRHFLNARGLGGFFLAGVANGFLPCGLVLAFLALALASGGVAQGALIMIAFGLGTVPAMVAIGCGANLMSHAVRAQVFRLAASLVIISGALTIHRGWSPPAEDCCAEEIPVAMAN